MLKNVIILTCGQSGSSVLTGLIARAGFWVGDDTKTVGYDTYENAQLVDINRELLAAAGVDWDDQAAHLNRTIPGAIEACRSTFDTTGSKRFLESCAMHRPWLWKDPRLPYTIRYWESILDVSDCRFIIMERDFRQAWTGHVLRGLSSISLSDYSRIHQRGLDEAHAYVRERKIPHIVTSFEDLMLEPARVIAEVNEFLDTTLTVGDLSATYRGPLGKLRWSSFDLARAWTRHQLQHRVVGPVRHLLQGREAL